MKESSSLSPTKTAATFKERSTFLPEVLHAGLILAPWTAVIYSLFESRRDELIVPIFFVSLIFALATAFILRTVAGSAGSLWIYLGCVALCFPLFVLTCLIFNRVFRDTLEVVLTCATSFIIFCFLAVDNCLIRIAENSRRRAYLENDRSYRVEERPTSTPGIGGLVFYLIFYCVGLLFDSPRTSDIGLWGGIAYLLVLLVYMYLRSDNSFLLENKNLKRVPVRRIRKIGNTFLAGLIIVTLLLCLIPLFTSGLRRYTNIRDWGVDGFNLEQEETHEEQKFEEPRPEPMQMPDLSELAPSEPNPVLDAIFRALTLVLGIVAVLGLVIGIIAAIIGVFKKFRDDPGENGDIITAIDPEDKVTSLKRERRLNPFRKLSDKEKIRKKYRDLIRKATKEKPVISHTPSEIEAFAGLTESEEMQAFHKVYEDARYGK